MSDREDHDSDAPEEFTAQQNRSLCNFDLIDARAAQGIQQDEEIRKIQTENKNRVVREGKERRRQWAEKLTPRPSKASKHTLHQDDDDHEDLSGSKPQQKSNAASGFLPDDIVQELAAREKKNFFHDSDEEKDEIKPSRSKKRKSKKSGLEPVCLNELGPPQCLHSALEFLKERKMSVQRSSSVLNNSNRALRLLSSSGVLRHK